MGVKCNIGVLMLIAIFLSGSAFAAEKKMMGDSKEMANKEIMAAEAARIKAKSVEGEWRDTGKIIKRAKAAATDGDYDKAIKLAKTARAQGEAGYSQAMSQKELRIPSYLK